MGEEEEEEDIEIEVPTLPKKKGTDYDARTQRKTKNSKN
jgi:hypothetical protein